MADLKNSKLYLLLWLSLFTFACSANPTSPSASPTPVASFLNTLPESKDDEIAVIETDFGEIKLQFYPDYAPKHVAHFKKLIREGFYNGLAFHRVIPDLIIQGGDPTTRGNDRALWGMGEPNQPTVPAEFNELPFVRGSVGAARKGNDINSATSQFFICSAPNPSWNGQYTVFARVIEGMNIADIISKAPRDEDTEMVLEKVVMRRVYLEKR